MPRLEFIVTVTNVTLSFPVRHSALHYCLQASKGNFVLNNSFLGSVVNVLPAYSKVRSRIHVGSIMEHQYALRSHGIPIDTFPVDINGNIRDDIFYAWFYKYRRAQIENRVPVDHVGQVTAANLYVPSAVKPSAKPTENDILLGRGLVTQSWPGNIKFREFLEKFSSEYDNLPRKERKKRTIELTQELCAKRIRFFEPTGPGEWAEIDFSEARKKVSQHFRTIRKKK